MIPTCLAYSTGIGPLSDSQQKGLGQDGGVTG